MTTSPENDLKKPQKAALKEALNCVLTRSRLVAFHRGGLDSALAMEVRRHLLGCVACNEADQALLAPAFEEITKEWSRQFSDHSPLRRVAQMIIGAIGLPGDWMISSSPAQVAAKGKGESPIKGEFWKRLQKADLRVEAASDKGLLKVGLISSRYNTSDVTVKLGVKDKSGRFRTLLSTQTNRNGIASFGKIDALPRPKNKKGLILAVAGLYEKQKQ